MGRSLCCFSCASLYNCVSKKTEEVERETNRRTGKLNQIKRKKQRQTDRGNQSTTRKKQRDRDRDRETDSQIQTGTETEREGRTASTLRMPTIQSSQDVPKFHCLLLNNNQSINGIV